MKISLALLGLIGLTEAGKRKPQRAQTTTTTTLATSTTTSTSIQTQTTPVVAAAGTFAAAVTGQWHISSGTDAGNNMNVMLNSGAASATVVITNNDGSLVLGVEQATIDEAADTITIAGNVGSMNADGTITFADGTVWGAGAATTTTVATPAVTPDAGGDASDPYASGGSQYSGGSSGSYDASSGSSGTYDGSSGSSGAYDGSGGAGGSGGSGGGTGMISGDPHVVVQAPGQKKVCYDVHGDELDYVSLVYDPNLDLEINGQLTHVKADKSRLSAIGFKTPAGVEIGIFNDRVTVGYRGKIEDQYDYNDYMRVTTDDATIEILSKNDAKHQGVMIEMNNGLLFHVSDKEFKDSMRLEILRGDALSGRMTGVLGQTIQPNDYVVNPDGSIMVEDRYIPESTWDAKYECHRIRDFDVRDFLGHSVYQYAVDGIFSTIDQAWLQIELQSELDPK